MNKKQYKIKETNINKLKAFLKDVSKHKRDRNTCKSNDWNISNNNNRLNRRDS